MNQVDISLEDAKLSFFVSSFDTADEIIYTMRPSFLFSPSVAYTASAV